MMKRRMIRITVLLGGGVFLGVVYLLLLLFTPFEGIPCLFREATGLLCPGCGLTHALTSLARGDVLTALTHLPLLPLYLLWGGWILVLGTCRYVKGETHPFSVGPLWVHLLMAGTVLAFWILRNL